MQTVTIEFYAGPCDGDRTTIPLDLFNSHAEAECVIRRPITDVEKERLTETGQLFDGITMINHVYHPHPRRNFTMLYSHSFAVP